MSLSAWIAKMSLRKSVCDEIALYVLCKLYSRHALIYTAKGYWSTINETELTGLTGLEIEGKCDLSMIYTEKGLVLCRAIEQQEEDEANRELIDKGKSEKQIQWKTKSIQSLLKEKEDKEREKANKVSAKLSVENILPDSDRTHNMRVTTPLRRRQNFREKRPSCTYKNYSDNLDTHHLDSPPTKRQKRRNVARTLREPSSARISAQTMITRGELQCSVSPDYRCRLIGMVVKDEKENKPKVKEEEDQSRNTRRSNRSWPKDARLVHVDRTPCSETCMRTHPDDDDIPTTTNTSIEKTDGMTNKELQGVPVTSPNDSETLETVKPNITPSDDDELLTNVNKSIKETYGTKNKKLHGVPNTTRSTTELPSELEKPKLSNVSETKTNKTQDSDKVEPNSEPENINDSTATEDIALPEIPINREGSIHDVNIDLQQDLNAENVTQTNMEILEELSEFSNILNLDDNTLNPDLPSVGTISSDPPIVDPALDLEIAMENARFLEANPLTDHGSVSSQTPPVNTAPTNPVCHRSRLSSSSCTTKPTNSSPPNTHNRTRTASSTADNTNSRVTRIRSPKGTVRITNYVL